MPSISYTRTKKGVKNSIISLLLQFIAIFVGFFSRKLFLDYLGAEVLGLNTTSQSILGFLNLAELGIGSAIAVTLYKPLFDGNREAIKEIIALQGWLYKKIALIIICSSVILSFFFPLIFSKSELPIYYAYLSFGVMLFSSLLSYFVNYKEIILSANQDEYKIQLSWKVVSIIKLIAQAFAVKYCTGNPFVWWVCLEFAFSIISALALNTVIYRTAPYLYAKVPDAKKLRHKYPEVSTKVKQLFVHKIGSFAIGQSTPLIIYAFSSLTLVALYGNYLVITSNLGFLLASAFTGLTAGIGSVAAEGNKCLMKKIYREIFTLRFFLVSVCSICVFALAQPFVSLWIGTDYLLSKTTLLLIVILFFCMNFKNISEYFIGAYGIFQDIWSPLAEAGITLGGSILLGYFYGLNGVLLGSIISQIIIHFIWKPYFLFTYGFKESVTIYIGLFMKHLCFLLICRSLLFLSLKVLNFTPGTSILQFLKYSCFVFSFSVLILGGLSLLFEKGARSLLQRIAILFFHSS